MKTGKLSLTAYKRSIKKHIHSKRSSLGMDFAAIALDEKTSVTIATKPVVLINQEIGKYGVVHALNNIYCSGGEALGITTSLYVPTIYNEAFVRELTIEIDAACQEAGIEILGGHTEVVKGIKEPMLTITAIGKASHPLYTAAAVKPGMDVLVTKWVGLHGTAILAQEKEEELLKRLSVPFLDRAKTHATDLSVREAVDAIKDTGVCYLHDLSRGGVFAGLWELGEAAGCGLEIDLKKIPLKQETIEICEYLDVNPYKLLSTGSLLIVSEDGNATKHALEKQGINVSIIGKTTGDNDRVLLNEEERRFIEISQPDELYGME